MPFRRQQRAHPVRRKGGVCGCSRRFATFAWLPDSSLPLGDSGALAQPTKSEKAAPKAKASAQTRAAAKAPAKAEKKADAKSPAKAQATTKSPPLPTPSPRRVGGAASPADDGKDEAAHVPPSQTVAAVPPAIPNSPEATYFAEMDKLIAPLRD